MHHDPPRAGKTAFKFLCVFLLPSSHASLTHILHCCSHGTGARPLGAPVPLHALLLLLGTLRLFNHQLVFICETAAQMSPPAAVFVVVVFHFFLFRAAPTAHSSGARGLIRAATASLRHSHSNVGSHLHCSSQQCLILNLLSKARDRTCILMDTLSSS